jgi:conjugal transfer pilus assembly protein TraF
MVVLCALLCMAAVRAWGADDGPPADKLYWQDAWRGWHFYEDPPRETPAPAVQPPRPSAAATAPSRAPELLEFERLQKTLEEYRQVAIVRPTEANVRRYMALEARVVERASRFADLAQRIAWADPDLDPTLRGRPVNAKAIEVFEQTQQSERTRAVSALAKDHVLLYFFRGDCPYCHAFAPILRSFADRHGLGVLAVSLDGGTTRAFPGARRGNGIASTLRVNQVPAVFLAQPGLGRITPVGFGMLSDSQLLERLAHIAAGPADVDTQPLLPAPSSQRSLP